MQPFREWMVEESPRGPRAAHAVSLSQEATYWRSGKDRLVVVAGDISVVRVLTAGGK